MASGTPLLTTALPGMPKEYQHYVYLFEVEITDGYWNALNVVLNLPQTEREEKGMAAKTFVLRFKNNEEQVNQIIKLVS